MVITTSYDHRQLYAHPIKLLLPATSEVPSLPQCLDEATCFTTPDTLVLGLTRVVAAAEELQQKVEQTLAPMLALTAGMTSLQQRLSEAQVLLAAEQRQLTAIADKATAQQAAAQQAQEELPDHVMIDRLFYVIRIPDMTTSQWNAQVVTTCQQVLSDLPFTVLAVDEVAAIIHSIKMMVALLIQESSPGKMPTSATDDNEPIATAMRATAYPAGYEDLLSAWQAPNALASDWERKAAYYRWIIGHHLFLLCTMYCRSRLLRVSSALSLEDEAVAAHELTLATRFFRGTTASLWYASNFPARLYASDIRPILREFGPSSGASGTKIFDYEEMKAAKDLFKTTLFTHYGNNPRTWPAALRHRVQEFSEVYIQDMEQHTLMAASKAGIDSSLAQKIWQAELPSHLPMSNATSLLREMTVLRREEFQF